MEKLKRAANFSTYEEELLVSLVAKRKEVLECKKTDVNTSRVKELEWQDLSEEFNANSAHPRDAQTLRRKYENIKKRTKKKYADEKVYLKGTGGGPTKHLTFSYVDESLKSILGTRVTGKRSEFDDDHDSDLDDKENKVSKTSSLVAGTTEHIIVEVVDEDSTEDRINEYTFPECSKETDKYTVSTNQYQYDSTMDMTVLQQPESINSRPTAVQMKNSKESFTNEASTNESLLSGYSDIIYDVEDTKKDADQCKVLKDWSKYDPTMLQQPRSFSLMPCAIQKKIATSVTPRRILQEQQSAQKSATTPKSTPKTKCNTVWTHVGNAKLDLIKIQKEIIIDENQRKREREDEIHTLTLQHKKEEHAIKMKILETELMSKTK